MLIVKPCTQALNTAWANSHKILRQWNGVKFAAELCKMCSRKKKINEGCFTVFLCRNSLKQEMESAVKTLLEFCLDRNIPSYVLESSLLSIFQLKFCLWTVRTVCSRLSHCLGCFSFSALSFKALRFFFFLTSPSHKLPQLMGHPTKCANTKKEMVWLEMTCFRYAKPDIWQAQMEFEFFVKL